MPSDSFSARLALPYLLPNQAQKHVTVNDALSILDTLVHPVVISRTVSTPPPIPADGDTYLVAATADGAWEGKEGTLATFRDSAWSFLPVPTGLKVFVEDESLLILKDASGWANVQTGPGLEERVERLGIGTDADETNRLAARLNTALLTALAAADSGTGDIRLILNREDASSFASLLFQTDSEAGGEVGLLSSGRLSLKAFASPGDPDVQLHLDGANGRIELEGDLVCGDINRSAIAGDRNKLINGNFAIWQRGDGPFDSHNEFTADRWYQIGSPSIVPGTVETQRVPTTPGQTVSASALRTDLLGASDFQLRQKIADVRTLAGKPAALSLAARADTTRSLRILGQQWFGTGGSSARTVFDITLDVGTDWSQLSTVFEFPSLDGMTIGPDSHIVLVIRANGWPSGSWFEVTDLQLEEGVRSTLFGERGLSQEMTACRYFFRKYATVQNVADLACEMRTTPAESGSGPYFYDAEL